MTKQLGHRNYALLLVLCTILAAAPLAAQQQAFSMLDSHLVRIDLDDASIEMLDSADDDRISDLTGEPGGGLIGLRFPVIGGEIDGLVAIDPASGAIENLGSAGTVGATALAHADGMLWLGLGDTVANFVGDTALPTTSFTLPWTVDALAGRDSTLYAFGKNTSQVELVILDLDSASIETLGITGVFADRIDDAAIDASGSLWVRTLVTGPIMGSLMIRHYRLDEPQSGAAELVSETSVDPGTQLQDLVGLAFGTVPVLDIPTLGRVPLLALMLLLAFVASRWLRRQ